MAKYLASEYCKEVVEDAFRIHDGGYSKEYEIELSPSTDAAHRRGHRRHPEDDHRSLVAGNSAAHLTDRTSPVRQDGNGGGFGPHRVIHEENRDPRNTVAGNRPREHRVLHRLSQRTAGRRHPLDRKFAVQRVQIVGTDLRMVEQVYGRLDWARAVQGRRHRRVDRLFVALLLWIVVESIGLLGALAWGLVNGAIFGLIFGLVSYAFTGGKRDFVSRSAIVPQRYDIMVEVAVRLRGEGHSGRDHLS